MIAGVPYDAEIEYLESTGTQWIDIGISNYNTEWFSRLVFSLSSPPPSSFIGLYGARSAEISGIYCTINNNRLFLVNGNYSYVPLYAHSFVTEHRYEIKTENSKRYLDGKEITGATFVSSVASVGVPLYLFAANNNNQNVEMSNWLRIYGYSIGYNSNNKICDLIPVRVGQDGYMYDRVTRKLFGNAGAGAFVLGPDVAMPVMGIYEYPEEENN